MTNYDKAWNAVAEAMLADIRRLTEDNERLRAALREARTVICAAHRYAAYEYENDTKAGELLNIRHVLAIDAALSTNSNAASPQEAAPEPASAPLPDGWTVDGSGPWTAWCNDPASLAKGYRGYRMAEWDGEALRIVSATQIPAAVLRALLGMPQAPCPECAKLEARLGGALYSAQRECEEWEQEADRLQACIAELEADKAELEEALDDERIRHRNAIADAHDKLEASKAKRDESPCEHDTIEGDGRGGARCRDCRESVAGYAPAATPAPLPGAATPQQAAECLAALKGEPTPAPRLGTISVKDNVMTWTPGEPAQAGEPRPLTEAEKDQADREAECAHGTIGAAEDPSICSVCVAAQAEEPTKGERLAAAVCTFEVLMDNSVREMQAEEPTPAKVRDESLATKLRALADEWTMTATAGNCSNLPPDEWKPYQECARELRAVLAGEKK